MALIPHNVQGQGWLRPATGVIELTQCVIQVIYFDGGIVIVNFSQMLWKPHEYYLFKAYLDPSIF